MLRKCGRVCARSVRDSMTHRMITVITPPITPPITPSIPPQPHIPPNSANSSIDESTIKVQGSVTLVDTALNSSISVANDNWNWVAPATLEQEETPLFTTIYGTLLSSNEVKNALVTLSAADVTVLHLHKKLDTISEFVIASGKSRRHLMKMADTLVEAVCDIHTNIYIVFLYIYAFMHIYIHSITPSIHTSEHLCLRPYLYLFHTLPYSIYQK